MKIKAILASLLMAGTALATTETVPTVTQTPDFDSLPALSKERLSGSTTLAATTNYTGRGYVLSRAATGGDGAGIAAVKLNYDFGKKNYWSADFTMAYEAVFSGHTLYGNPRVSPAYVCAAQGLPINAVTLAGAQQYIDANDKRIGEKNVENQFAIISAAKYKRDKWNVSMGHQFVHGGLYGAMAKHFRHQSASCTNEAFITPEWTPTAWFAAGVKTSLSFQGLHGWWFEPYMTFKAPLVGTENGILSNASQDLKLAAVVTLAMTATAEYYNYGDFACSNGSQAFWINVSTPWFVRDNFILTPSVAFHWLGKGGMKANEQSHVKQATGNSCYVPFKNFGVVGTLSATYTF